MSKKKKGKKAIKTKKGINPFTGAILTIPAEKNPHQKLEEEVWKAAKEAMEDMQPLLKRQEEERKRAWEKGKDHRIIDPPNVD